MTTATATSQGSSRRPTENRSQARLWSASTLEGHGSWRRDVPLDVAEEFLDFLAASPGATADGFDWDPARLPRLAAFGARVREQLVGGYGLCRIGGVGGLGLTAEHQRCLYAALGCSLGTPMTQYGRLYPVVDRGASYTEEAVPVSMTNSETSFHTDSSAVDAVPDFVGLLCEQPSNHGGDSLVSNALRVRETLRREAPGALEVLSRPWIRDVVTPGIEKTREALLRNRFPVFGRCERTGGVLFRYMRYWIETGQEKAGRPIGPDARAAFDLLDELLERPENVVRFRLDHGDVLWVNNRTLAHNRTAYRDEPGNVRKLQRMWIRADSSPA